MTTLDLYGKSRDEIIKLVEAEVRRIRTLGETPNGKPIFNVKIERKLESMQRLIDAFKDLQTGKSQSKTWEQLSSLPKATRSRLLREAMEKGYVTGSVKVKNGRRETIYELKTQWPILKYMAIKARLKTPSGMKDLGSYYPIPRKVRGGKLQFKLPQSETDRLKKAIELAEEPRKVV
jgi:hypothetical protein